MILRYLHSLAFCGAILAASAQPSVLQSGEWFQFSVKGEGIHKIDFDLLRQAGINPDQIDPRNIQLFAGHYGMLPQLNSAPRVRDLQEVAIEVTGESDGRFNRGDLILFYAQGADRFEFRPVKGIHFYENNLYEDENFYYLSVRQPGKRITSRASESGNFPVVRDYQDFGYFESERHNELKSGRQWFGEQFDARLDATIQFEIPGIVTGTPIRMASHVMAQAFSNSSFKLLFNNTQVVEQVVPPIPNAQYGPKGAMKIDTLLFTANSVNASGQSNQQIRYEYTKASSLRSVGYLDYFIFTCTRDLALRGNQTRFSSSASLSNAVSTFEINSIGESARVWDVTDPINAVSQGFTANSGKAIFSVATASLRSFVVFNAPAVSNATFKRKMQNQNLHQGPAVSLVIISAPDLWQEAQRLANHRQQRGVSAWVVTTAQIYHEYSGGKQDIVAIRDFIRDQFDRTGSLKNVLLFGRGSYDYKNRIQNNTNLVPLYLSRNSLSPLETYSSDDFYGFLEPNEGEWGESPSQNHSLDVGIGRLPVKNLDEAKVVVTKLIEYDTHPDRLGPWHKRLLFVADDGDFNIHHNQSNDLARNNFEINQPQFDITRVWVDNFEQIERASGQVSPAAYQALDEQLEKGAVIINFTGHGSEQIWMQERILDENMIMNWRNRPLYPLFVTATCEFGRHDDPQQISSGEKTLLKKNGGTIGLVTTARPVNSSTNFTLNQAFYNALFNKPAGHFRDLGSIFRETKNNSQSGVANRNFSLLSDPSMFLALPEQTISITQLETTSGSNTLKALSKVRLAGNVQLNGQPDQAFNGDVWVTLFDKISNRQTKGDENQPFSYSEYDNALFRGKAEVIDGQFELEFILPASIPATVANNKISLYASSGIGAEAARADLNIPVGGMEPNAPADDQAPLVSLFMADTTFQPGELVGPNTVFIAQLEDKSGINISSTDERFSIKATLDGNQVYVLNDYYIAASNDYQKGSISFPLKRLTPGRHVITFSVADTYLNLAVSQIEFYVSESNAITIGQFANFPNPFQDETTFSFTHTRQTEDLEVQLRVFNMMGQPVHEQYFTVTQSPYRVWLSTWDGRTPDGTKNMAGIYVARIAVRCLSDGSKNEAVTKIIILN